MAYKDIFEKEIKLLELTKKLCGTTDYFSDDCDTPDVPTESTYDIAFQILETIGVDIANTEIYEIPLCWDNQVCIRYFNKDDVYEEENKHTENCPYHKTYTIPNTLFDFCCGIGAKDRNIFFIEVFAELDSISEDYMLYKRQFDIREFGMKGDEINVAN